MQNRMVAALLFQGLAGCSAAGHGADCTDDTTTDATPAPTSMEPVDTAPPASTETADTGNPFPSGLHGTPFDPPLEPLAEFEALDLLEFPRGPDELYSQRTVLLLTVGSTNQSAITVGTLFNELRADFDALDARIIAVTPQAVATNWTWVTITQALFDVWSDRDTALFIHHGTSQSETETFLLDETGRALVHYDGSRIRNDEEAHPGEVLADAQLLWGDAE